MNTLLCSYLSAHAAEDTLFVLWGFSSEDAGLPRPSLDALLQQRLSRYLSSLLQQNPCVITAEELWAALGEQGSVCDATWPKYDEQYLKENDMQLTISFNGKARFQMTFPVDTPNEEIQKQVLADEKSQKYLEGFNVLKVIIVPKKIVNVVLKK